MRVDTIEYKPVIVISKYKCDRCGCEIKKEYDFNSIDYEITRKIERANEDEKDCILKSRLELCSKCDDVLSELLKQHGFKVYTISDETVTRNT